MTKEQYKAQFSDEDPVGWQAIDKVLEQLYPGQTPQHFAPQLYYSIGGTEPLDGISIYYSAQGHPHFHFITYGFSQLYYDEESAGSEWSKFGFELSFRPQQEGSDGNLFWVCNLLQNLAKYVFKSGKWFEEFDFIPVNSPLRQDSQTSLTALTFITDPELGSIDTPNGKVQFLQMVGITTPEFDILKQNGTRTASRQLLETLRENNHLLVTDMNRK